MDNAPSGNLSDIDASDIALAIYWPGEPSTIVAGLLKVGFIDHDMKIHNWDKYIGRLLIQRETNAMRQKAFRDRQSQLLLSKTTEQTIDNNNNNALRNDNVTVMLPLTVPNRTVPNLTEQNSTGENFSQKNNCNGLCKKCPKKNNCSDKFTKGKYGAVVEH